MDSVDIRYVKNGVIHRDMPLGADASPEEIEEWAKCELDIATDVEILEGMMDFDNANRTGDYFDADSIFPECVELTDKDYRAIFQTDLWAYYLGISKQIKDKAKSYAMGFYLTGTELDYGTWEDLFESRDLRNDNFWPTEEFENYSDDDIKNSIAAMYKGLYETFGGINA